MSYAKLKELGITIDRGQLETGFTPELWSDTIHKNEGKRVYINPKASSKAYIPITEDLSRFARQRKTTNQKQAAAWWKRMSKEETAAASEQRRINAKKK